MKTEILLWVSVLLQAIAIIVLSSKVSMMDKVLHATARKVAFDSLREIRTIAEQKGMSVEEFMGNDEQAIESFKQAEAHIEEEIKADTEEVMNKWNLH